MAQTSGQENRSVEDLKPVYLIYGQEQLLLDEAVTRLKNSFAEEGDIDFNFDQFNGGSDSAAAVVQAAQTLPFMSPKRLLLVKDVDKFASSDTKVLADYLNSASPSTCMVLVASDIKKASPIYKAADKTGQVFEYKLPSKNEYPLWAKERFKVKGKTLKDGAARLLIESVGYNLNKLDSEIEKISLFYADKAEIDEKDVTALVCTSSENSIFDLVDSIGQRDIKSAFIFLRQLLEVSGDPPQLIFYMITRQFRLLLKTRSLLDRGLSDQAISKELKVLFFVAKKLREQCRNFSADQLRQIYRSLGQADLALKTSERQPRLLLEDLLVKIIG